MRNTCLALLLALVAPLSASAQESDPAGESESSEETSTHHHKGSHDHKWEFKLRAKAAVGIHARDIVDGRRFLDSGDVGLLIEPLHLDHLNLNGFVSFRSVGFGVGHDITKNFGVAALVNTPWHDWRPTPVLAAYFSF